jgi:DNA-binding winged helix-turn-helix (wHTH) protein
MTDVIFGPFSLDAADSRLLRDGVEVKLRPQALQALIVLLRHRGRVVGYEQMIAEAWNGTFVSRHTVDVTVGEVRKSLGEFGSWISHRPKKGYCLDVPASDELVRKGWHFWTRRTREGCERAIDCFQQAAEECPGDFRAFEGLAASYLLLAVFGMRPPRDMYPRFLEAHARAVALGGLTPELRCDRAHGLHVFEHRDDEAEAEFLQAVLDKPTFAPAYVRLAMLYATGGKFAEACDALERGYQADPLLPTLPVTRVLVSVWRREFETATTLGAETVDLHPYLQVGRAIYAEALMFSGRLDEALAQYRRGSLTSPDLPWLRALEGVCLAKLERLDEARAILKELEQLRCSEYIDAYHMAILRWALGQHAEAFSEFARARAENSAFLYSMDVDPKIDGFRDDPRLVRQ